jgi:hypothetical protein
MFSPDQEILSLSVQQPGADGTESFYGLRAHLHLSQAHDALAGFSRQSAAPAFRACHHQERRRQDA